MEAKMLPNYDKYLFQGDAEFFQEVEDFRQEIYELYEDARNETLSDDDQIRYNEWRNELNQAFR
jgi:hypothetical protein